MDIEQVYNLMVESGWIGCGSPLSGYTMEPHLAVCGGKRDVYAIVTRECVEFGSATVHVGYTIVVDNPNDLMTPRLARQVFEKIAAAYYTPSNDDEDMCDDDLVDAMACLPNFG